MRQSELESSKPETLAKILEETIREIWTVEVDQESESPILNKKASRLKFLKLLARCYSACDVAVIFSSFSSVTEDILSRRLDANDKNWRKILASAIFECLPANAEPNWATNVVDNDRNCRLGLQLESVEATIRETSNYQFYNRTKELIEHDRFYRGRTPPMTADLSIPLNIRYAKFKSHLITVGANPRHYFGARITDEHQVLLESLLQQEPEHLKAKILDSMEHSGSVFWRRYVRRNRAA